MPLPSSKMYYNVYVDDITLFRLCNTPLTLRESPMSLTQVSRPTVATAHGGEHQQEVQMLMVV